jgi:hypothetical protein
MEGPDRDMRRLAAALAKLLDGWWHRQQHGQAPAGPDVMGEGRPHQQSHRTVVL